MKRISWVFWNFEERRLRSLWRIIIQGVLFLLLDGLMTFVVGLVFAIFSTKGAGSALVLLTGSQTGTTLSVFATLLAMLASYLFASRVLDRRPFPDFGFHFNRRWWQHFGFGLGLGAFLMTFIFLVELATGWLKITGILQRGSSDSFWGGLALAAVLFICVGIYEEMLARGYQLRNLAEGLHIGKIKPGIALVGGYVLSSIIFGLLHADNPSASFVSTVNLFMAGLFLGLGYVLTGELALPIGLHITWNFFEGNVFGFPVSGTNAGATIFGTMQIGPEIWTGGSFGPEAGLIGIAALILGSLLIGWWVWRKNGKVSLADKLAVYQYRRGGFDLKSGLDK